MKKGISPLVATILLIALTLGATALISGWLSSTMKSSTETVGSGISSQLSCSKVTLDIIDATCTNGGNITVVVSNLGNIAVDSPTVYVKSSQGSVCINATSNTSATIPSGGSMVIKFVTNQTSGCSPWNTESLSYVRVTSICQGKTTVYTEKTLDPVDSCAN